MYAECEQRECVDECATCHTRIGLETHAVYEGHTYHVRYLCAQHLEGKTYDVHNADGGVSVIGYSSERVIPGQTTLGDHLRQP